MVPTHYNKDLHAHNKKILKCLQTHLKEVNDLLVELRFTNDDNPLMKEYLCPLIDQQVERISSTYNDIPTLLLARMQAIERHILFNSDNDEKIKKVENEQQN